MSGNGRDREDDFLEEPAAAFAAPLFDTNDSTDRHAVPDELRADIQAAVGERYRVERELGRGGMATVFLAHDTKHGRPVALKVLHRETASALGSDRFVREIETAAGLAHPHILPLFDSGRARSATGGGDLLYYAMPYVDGESLRDRLTREGHLSVPLALRLAREVADALAYAHRRGVVHRDIKPANVMLTSGSESVTGEGVHCLLADFGIARALARASGSTDATPHLAGTDEHRAHAPLTATGLIIGTPTYMSPEQAAGEHDLDGRSDIYSLGCVLYEMLAGEPPFTGGSAHEVITRRLTAPPPSVRRVRPDVSATLDTVIARAMAPAPAERFQTADELRDALGRAESGAEPVADPSRVRQRRTVLALSAAVVTAAAFGAVALWRTRPVVAAPAASIVVLPPTPVTPDTALTRLGRELAITLSANLDGVGGIHAADALGVLANLESSRPALSLDDARAFAGRLGARSVVRGTIIRAGDSVRVDVTLHPVTCPPVGCEQPLATATASAPAENIASLTDQVTWALLRGVWQREGAPTPSLAAVTTHSIPALRAFLDGERAIVDGRWREAPALFERAFTEDTNFVLAYWRYALARNYWQQPVDAAIRAKYRASRNRFPQRDSLLITAELSDSTSIRYERTKAAAERFTDYWPAWWTLSDRLAHETPLIGTSSRDLRAALERTVSLNPRMASAWTHLFWVALWERDTVLADRALEQLTAIGYDTVSVREQGFDEVRYYRYLAEVMGAGGLAPDTMLREPGVRMFTALRGPVDPLAFGVSMTQYGLGREQVQLSTAIIRRGASPSVAVAHQLALAVAQAQRGAWDSSLVAMDAFVAGVPDPSAPLYAYRLAVIGAWLGALDPEAAVARRGAALRDSVSLPPAGRAELAWLGGILAIATRDTNALGAARRALGAADSVTAPLLARSLAAFADALGGEPARAADSLVALERERAERGLSRYRSDAHPFLTAVNRLAAARWLRESGRPGEAARLLTWHEAVLVPMRTTRQANAMVQGLAYLERARAAEALGRTELARDYYRRFFWHYDAPTALHRHLVEEATRAAARLGPGTGDLPQRSQP